MNRACENARIQHGDDRFTLGTVLQTLSSQSQARNFKSKDKSLIRENIIRVLKQENSLQSSFHAEKSCGTSSENFNALRKSLKEQVENAKTKQKKPHCYKKHRHYHEEKHSYISNNESPSILITFPQGSSSQNAMHLEQNEDQAVENIFVNSVEEETSSENNALTQMFIKSNLVYSRHLQNNTEDSEFFRDGNNDLMESSAFEDNQRRQRRQLRRVSTASSILSNTSASSRKRSQSQTSTSEELKTSVKEEKNRNKTEDESEFISGISDPSLKDSLQKIIQRRKSVVCLFKSSSGGLKVLNENETFSAIEEENSSVGSAFESETIKSESNVFGASLKSEYDVPLKEKEYNVMDNYLFSGIPTSQSAQYPRKKGILKNRQQHSAHSRRASQSARTPNSARENFNRSKYETEETKMIMPLSSNTWRPSLVPKQPKKRTNTAHSCPETKKEKKKILDKNKDDVIRDFIIMYAKVKNRTPIDIDEAENGEREVSMISQTPEFVVKSAIGQFLTSSFPSDRYTTSVNSKEEKYEAKQRTRLLKIKNCMKQLAELA